MIPLRDENPTRRFPIVTVGIIAINVVVAVYSFTLPVNEFEGFVSTYGAVPALLFSAPQYWLTLVTSMFMHGGVAHLGGNMLYLWIFGNNVEDHLGHVKFLLFYLICGFAAALTHALTEVSSTIPMVGASGAISGILGAYLVLYPHARVVTLVALVFFIRFVPVPAYLVLGVWFLMQLTGILGPSGGIAFFAHIGGFIFGLFGIFLFGSPRRARSRSF